jgi:predicted Zn-dependent peptidase
MGFPAPPFGDEDSYAMDVLGELLAGEGGRLVEQLVYSQGLAYDVSFRYETYARGGAVEIGLTTSCDDEDKGVKALESELTKLSGGPITYREYRSAVNAAIGAYGISQQERFGQIYQLARGAIAGLSLDSVQDVVTRIQDVKEEDLPDLIRRIFNLNNAVTVRLHGMR